MKLDQKNKDLTIIVDNTWVTGKNFNPFNFKVDFVVASLTKYYSAVESLHIPYHYRTPLYGFYQEHD
jgi:hypothetical protein